ncbi:MAG: hypothetical protein JW702_05605, partial [Clostridiales bacterium]|nr:hypothetical protein [Clostridiales bacterium]
MKKWELYKEGKIKLSKEEIESYKYSEYRHNRNEESFNTFITIIKLPYYIFWKFPAWTIRKVTFKDMREKQQKEIERLKLVMESKERARKSNILELEKYEKAFEVIGFKDKLGNYPLFHSIEKDEDRETISFKSNLTLSEWMNKKESLETVLDTNVVSIKHQKESKQIVYLDTTKKGMPKLLEWKDEYLINDGILPIGQDIFGNLIKFEFIYVANVLIGGAPRGGKTKLFQLLAYQILRAGGHLIIAEFKELDYQKFENKCQVINDHGELKAALIKLGKERDKRKKLFRKVDAENIDDYNKKTGSNLKRYYLMIDELGEAMEIANP